jgi:RNase P/RNase MRP subunit POP5
MTPSGRNFRGPLLVVTGRVGVVGPGPVARTTVCPSGTVVRAVVATWRSEVTARLVIRAAVRNGGVVAGPTTARNRAIVLSLAVVSDRAASVAGVAVTIAGASGTVAGARVVAWDRANGVEGP